MREINDFTNLDSDELLEITKCLERENQRLREALKFYENEKNYTDQESIGNGIFITKIQEDGGRIAQKALEDMGK